MVHHIFGAFVSLITEAALIAVIWKIETIEFMTAEVKLILTIILGLGGIIVVVLKMIKALKEIKK
jgi:hypothetical protein